MSPPSSERPHLTPEPPPQRTRDGSLRPSVATRLEFEVPQVLQALAPKLAARPALRERKSLPAPGPDDREPALHVPRPPFVVGDLPKIPFARTQPLHRAVRELPSAGADSGVIEVPASLPSELVSEPPLAPMPRDASSSPDRATESVDMRVFLGQQLPTPELGSSEDSSSRWHAEAELPILGKASRTRSPTPQTAASQTSAPRKSTTREPAPLPSELRLRTLALPPSGRDRGIPRRAAPKPAQGPRKVLLFGGCLLALALLGASFAAKSQLNLPALASRLVATPSAAKPATTAAPVAAAAPVPVAAPPAKPSPKPQAQEHKPVTPHHERGGATPSSAAALYIQGQYKEALAEYRLLASENPRQTVYTEFARVLKRKLFDTCVRTQPNRREQCKQL